MNLSNFKKCNIAPNTRGNSMYVRLCKSQHTITLSPALSDAAGFKKGDRVDLYRYEGTFAIRKDKVGCLSISSQSTKSRSLHIRSASAYLEVSPFVKGKTILYAWVEDGIVFFTANDKNLEDE